MSRSADHPPATPRAPEPPRQDGARRTYAPPKLERLGNVHDLLGKTGPNLDANKKWPRRP